MAELECKDPEYGIPVATRIPEEIAFRFNKEAEQASKTLSCYLAEFIERAIANEKQLTELEAQLLKDKEIAKNIAGRFIVEISKGDKAKAMELIHTYNTILKDEKSK
jgi:predicted DNA-binding protein